jgi:hypothetical protein
MCFLAIFCEDFSGQISMESGVICLGAVLACKNQNNKNKVLCLSAILKFLLAGKVQPSDGAIDVPPSTTNDDQP